MPKPSRFATFLLLGLFATAAGAADVTVRQFTSQVQPVLNPQLSSWVATQSAAVTRATGPIDTASLRASAASALGARKATPENVEVMLALVLAAALQDAEQDLQQIATAIESNVALKQALRDIAARVQKTAARDILAAGSTQLSERQRELDALRKAAENLSDSGDATSQLAFELQTAATRASQAAQQLSAMMLAYSRSANSIIGNIRG